MGSGPSMTTSTIHPGVTRFSLPAEPCVSSVLRRFVRELARGTNLSADEIADLQVSAANAFNNALAQRNSNGHGCVTLQVVADMDEIKVDVAYQELPPPSREKFIPRP